MSACSASQQGARTPEAEATSYWVPSSKTSWQIQFSGELDTSIDADLYDLDAFDTDASIVARLHSLGRKAICYVNAGSWEDWRPDRDQFLDSDIGNLYSGWAGEKWLDIRRIDSLGPIMQARLDLCKQKGFDAVEFDNVNGYLNDTGFPLSYRDQLEYNIWLANETHQRGLAVGLKNDSEQAGDLWPYFDFAIVESCFTQGWCDQMRPFLDQGKTVLAIEYTDVDVTLEQFCPQAQAMQIKVIFKHRELDAYRELCR